MFIKETQTTVLHKKVTVLLKKVTVLHKINPKKTESTIWFGLQFHFIDVISLIPDTVISP